MKKWEFEYQGHTFRVEDSASKERLFVDGEFQDENFGFGFRSRLYGTLRDAERGDKPVRVALGGWVRQCRVFVDDRLVFHTKPDKDAVQALERTHAKTD